MESCSLKFQQAKAIIYSTVHLQLLQNGTKFHYKRLTEDDDCDDADDDDDVTIGAGNIQDTEAQLNLSQSEHNGTIHTIVLDMAPVIFIDSAGANTIKYVCYSNNVCPSLVKLYYSSLVVTLLVMYNCY